MGDLLDRPIFINMNIQPAIDNGKTSVKHILYSSIPYHTKQNIRGKNIPISNMVHGQHRVLLDDAVVLGQVLLGETGLVVGAAQRLAEEFALPVGR